MADWEARQATHLPFRILCQSACAGGENPAHARLPSSAEARGIAEVGLDYCFLKRADCEDKLTVLVQKDRDSRALRTQVVESKGRVCEEAVDAALRGMREFGHSGKVILKADGEASIRAL